MPYWSEIAIVSWLILGTSVGVLVLPPNASAAPGTESIVFVDSDGNEVRGVDYKISYNSTTSSIKVRVETTVPLSALLNQTWVDAKVPELALENLSFSPRTWDSRSWYEVELKSSGATFLDLRPFQPLRERSLYSKGSTSSIRLDRAMYIRVQEVPTKLTSSASGSNPNGTWSSSTIRDDGALILNLSDRNTARQEVRLNGSWLSSFGIGRPSFVLSGGEDIPYRKDNDTYVLRPPHFSFIYAFSTDEHFRKETDFPYSDVFWDQAEQYVFLRSDRRDTGDEWFSRSLPQEIDSTVGFTLSSTWDPVLQGNYQVATPLYLTSSRDVGALQASGIYFWYYSRNSYSTPPCADCNPKYYLFYYDRAGIARISDTTFEGGRGTEYKFYATYSAVTRILTMQIRNLIDAVLHSVSYTIGTNAGDDFYFGKLGTGSEDMVETNTAEPIAEGIVDDIQLTLGSIVNPSLEIDTNADGVPDGWHTVWLYASRSSEQSHSGTYSIKIDDTTSTNGGGMETDSIPAAPGRYYRAITYARVNSGSFRLSLKFLNGGGGEISQATGAVGTTDTYWRRMYVDAVSPPGTASARVMAWSLDGNIGVAYFDSFYLVESKLENAGFEEVVGTTPTHWTGISGTIPTAAMLYRRSGQFSLRLQDLSAVNPSPGVRSDMHPCVVGARYRAAAWVYVESASPGGTDTPFTLSLVFSVQGGVETAFRVNGGAVGAWDYLATDGLAPSACVGVLTEFKSSQVNIGVANMDDVEMLLVPAGLEQDSSVWAITVQGTPGGVDSLTPTNDLGVEHERWDWLWNSFQPLSQNSYDWNVVAQRRTYVRTANQVGVDVLIIVGGSLNEATPAWVTEANFVQAWNGFCERIGQEFGAAIYWYQLANEQNTLHGRFNSVTVFNVCFGAIKTGEWSGNFPTPPEHRWNFRSIVNAATTGSCFECDLNNWLSQAGSSIDVIAMDHYPGFGCEWTQSMTSLQAWALAYGKLAGVMETGMFSGFPSSEQAQASWIPCSLGANMRPIARQWNLEHYNSRYVIFGWYKLRDGGDTYGLQRQDGSQKLAYLFFKSETINYAQYPFNS